MALAEWMRATEDIRRSLQRKYEAEYEADVRREYGLDDDQPLTRAKQRIVRNRVRGTIVARLWELEEVNGVRNPTFDDPDFGAGIPKRVRTAERRNPNDELIEWLETSGDPFAAAILNDYRTYGTLNDGQLAAVRLMKERR